MARCHSDRCAGWWQLELAVAALRAGGLVLHATEGVWGLACDPLHSGAVARLLAVKSRSPDKGLILIAAEAEVFAPELDSLAVPEREMVLDSWPGRVTWLLPSSRFPHWITGGRDTVAVRVPGHAQARALCAAFGGPLVSTSANASGQPAILGRFKAQAFASQHPGIDYVLPGETSAGSSGPSEIRDPHGNILRPA